MNHERGGPDDLPPEAQIEMVADAVLVRARLEELREERQANLDRLGKMWQPTMQDIETADGLKSRAINAYTTARMENVEDLEFLDDAVALIDRAIEVLEGEPSRTLLVVALGVSQLQERLTELHEFRDLQEPLEELKNVIG